MVSLKWLVFGCSGDWAILDFEGIARIVAEFPRVDYHPLFWLGREMQGPFAADRLS